MDKGIIILVNILHSLAPSIFADSVKESGIALKEVIRIIKFHVLIAPGIITDHLVLYKCNAFTSIKFGIRPPLKYIVNIINSIIGILSFTFFRDNAYAPKDVIKRLIAVPTPT